MYSERHFLSNNAKKFRRNWKWPKKWQRLSIRIYVINSQKNPFLSKTIYWGEPLLKNRQYLWFGKHTGEKYLFVKTCMSYIIINDNFLIYTISMIRISNMIKLEYISKFYSKCLEVLFEMRRWLAMSSVVLDSVILKTWLIINPIFSQSPPQTATVNTYWLFIADMALQLPEVGFYGWLRRKGPSVVERDGTAPSSVCRQG